MQIANLEFAEVRDAGRIVEHAGERRSNETIEKHYPLVYTFQGRTLPIGTLTVVAGLDSVYHDLMMQAVTVLLSNGLKTFLVAGFVFMFFYALVNRHLERMANYVRNLDVRGSTAPLSLEGAPRHPPNELDELADAINAMQTQTRAALAAVVESEERLDLAANSSNIGVWDLDLRTQRMYVSPILKRQIGFGDDETSNRLEEWQERLHPSDRARVLDATNTLIEGKALRFQEEFRLRHKDGSYRWIASRGAAVHDDSGVPYRILGTNIDVTERKVLEARLKQFAALIEASPEFIGISDLEGNVISLNPAGCRMLGLDPQEALTKRIRDFVADDDAHLVEHEILPHIREKDLWHGEFRLRHFRTGALVPVEQFAFAIRDSETRQPIALANISHDISDRRKAEQALRDSEERFRLLVEGVQDYAIFMLDPIGRIVSWNPGAQAISGYVAEEVLGHFFEFFYPVEQRERRHPQRAIEAASRTGRYEEEGLLVRKGGGAFWAEVVITPLYTATGDLRGFVNVTRDVSERRRAEEQLNQLAHYDSLTGLPNRVLFAERLNRAIKDADRDGRRVGVMFVDLDRFKNINDTLGHDFGDNLLKVVAARLASAVRLGDTVARLSGDEFTFVLADMARLEDAGAMAQKILREFTEPFEVAGRDLFVTASIGVTLYPDDAKDLSALLRNADIAMYRAKEQGRNTYQLYSAEMTTRAAENLALEYDLRHAITRNELMLYYQPIVACASQRIVGLEALARWRHPRFGFVPPARFIPLAEENGLIAPLGEWVLREACRQCQRWRAEGYPALRIAVNLSARQFRNADIVQAVRAALDATGLDAAALEIEITESVLFGGDGAPLDSLRTLAALGVTLSIDDFGTGYSSLSYLKRFPVEALKIDQSFTRDIPDDKNDVALARAIINMARSLDLRTTAEGVETREQFEFFVSQGCDMAQGYYFSRPLPAAELAPLLARGCPGVTTSKTAND